MADWGGKVAAWFAGVAVASAALATLVAQMAAQPMRGAFRESFNVLVVIAVAAFIVLVFTGPRALWAARRARKSGQSQSSGPVPTPESGHPREGTRAIPHVPANQANRQDSTGPDRSLLDNMRPGPGPSVTVRGDNSGIIAIGDGTTNIQGQ